MSKSLVDLAYEFLLKRKNSSFHEIYEYVKNVKEIPIEEESKEMVNLYTDIVLDNRFLLIKDNEWALRKDYKYDEVKKQLDFLFAITDEELETSEIIIDEEAIVADDEKETFEELNDDVTFEVDDEEEEIDWDEIEKELEENN